MQAMGGGPSLRARPRPFAKGTATFAATPTPANAHPCLQNLLHPFTLWPSPEWGGLGWRAAECEH